MTLDRLWVLTNGVFGFVCPVQSPAVMFVMTLRDWQNPDQPHHLPSAEIDGKKYASKYGEYRPSSPHLPVTKKIQMLITRENSKTFQNVRFYITLSLMSNSGNPRLCVALVVMVVTASLPCHPSLLLSYKTALLTRYSWYNYSSMSSHLSVPSPILCETSPSLQDILPFK